MILLQTVIHWVSTGEKPNSKANPISSGAPNSKTVGEKSSRNPNPQNPKPADIRPKIEPLPSLGWEDARATPDQGRRRRAMQEW